MAETATITITYQPEEGGGDGEPTKPSVADPTITKISTATLGGNNIRITIEGTNYRENATATVGGVSTTNNELVSSTEFKCDADMSSLMTGRQTFKFTNADGTIAFAYINWTASTDGGEGGGGEGGGGGGIGGGSSGGGGGSSGGGGGGYYTPTPTTPPATWEPSEGCAIVTDDVELIDGFIIPKGSTICNDGSVLLTDGTWLPAGTATASHIKKGNVPSEGGVNMWVVGAILAGLGALGYVYSKRGGE
jgi:hypothetical protein